MSKCENVLKTLEYLSKNWAILEEHKKFKNIYETKLKYVNKNKRSE